ncbi:MAG TPA: LPXTG cell wall anchor domain-containing protein [Actinomycetota bacterium]|nr:LPXTG cell wall anchor domain-containing protein [Actinomycetota bacterium]
MKRLAAVLVGAMAFVSTFAGTALADYTEAPPPENVVEGVGGGAAFTGGDTATAAIVALALVVVGLVALFLARRRAIAAS